MSDAKPTGASDTSTGEKDGAGRVEVAQRIYGKNARRFLFISLGLASYIYSLDNSTTFFYLTFATSSLGHHSLISTVQVAQSIILAVGKPVVAKFADATSRGRAYVAVLVFYVAGCIVTASARNVQTIAGGIVLYTLGNTGLQLLTQIIIADFTMLKWRGLVSGLVTAPFIINGFVGSNIAASVINNSGWRWGYGMFAILVPVTLSPLIVVLLWAEHQTNRMVLVPASPKDRAPLISRVLDLLHKMDFIGLFILGVALSLFLIPLTLGRTILGGWNNASIPTIFGVGCILLVVFGIWDTKFAKYPVISPRFLRNRSVICASFIGFFDFVSFYLTFTYLFSYILVVKSWSLLDKNYFLSTQTIALTIFGIVCGVLLRIFRRYKAILTSGLLVRLLGVGLMIHSRGANGSTVELVWTQIIQGLGGGFAAAASQVAAQASVPHADVAVVTALVLLVTEVGGAVGNAIAGALWSSTMPRNLARYLPNTPPHMRDSLYANIITVVSLPFDDPVREGVALAYGETMKVMLVVATAIAVVPILLSLGMPDWELGDEQNAVTRTDLRARGG